MKYRNAREILPDPLLRELQRYVQGEALYIPAAGVRKSWGEGSGSRQYYARRNAAIRQRFRDGAPVEELAEDYALSPETVRKLVYTE